MRGPISYRIRCLKVCLVAITQRRQKNLAYAQQERWHRGRILNSAEEFDECGVCSFFFHQAAEKTKLEYAIRQGVRVFRTLPDEASEAGFDFERSDCRDPRRHAHQQATLTQEKALEQLGCIEPHPARPRLRARPKWRSMRHESCAGSVRPPRPVARRLKTARSLPF